MKLFYLLNTIYNSGGMERVLTLKANYLSRVYGYEIVIVTTHQKGRPSFFPIDGSIRHIDLDVNINLPFMMPRYVRRLNRLMEAERPDIVISLCYKDLLYLHKIKGECIKMAEFHFSHDTYRIKGQLRKMHRMEKAVAGLDCFVVLTQEDRQVWEPFCPHLEQIYNPSTFPVDGPLAPLEAKRFISGGRFEKQKNYQDMVRVWELVHHRHPDWVLDLYGCGKHKASVARLLKRLGLEDVIRLHPATGQMQQEMLGASGYLMTSLYEGFPMVLVECAAVGLPAVAWRCPCGPGEFIEDGKDGMTTEPGDIEGMAERICRLIEDEALRKKMGGLLREKAPNFSLERIMPQWDALFRRLVSTSSPTSPSQD
ncbi:MAG: glycosyltransferase family 4 protein [Bacteroidales bacterium]|nr:glycosyltransferase family 4 protein [Bacteroidales bacterium]